MVFYGPLLQILVCVGTLVLQETPSIPSQSVTISSLQFIKYFAQICFVRPKNPSLLYVVQHHFSKCKTDAMPLINLTLLALEIVISWS